MKIDTDFCKTGRTIRDGDQTWFKDGALAVHRSKVTTNHTFCHKPANGSTTWPAFAKFDDLKQSKKGGKRTLADVREQAEALHRGEDIAKSPRSQSASNVITLRDCLTLKLQRVSKSIKGEALRTGDSIAREVMINAYEWLDRDVRKITEKMVADRLQELVNEAYVHPYFEMTTDTKREAFLIEVGMKCKPRPRSGGETIGTAKTADQFARYLMLVINGTSDQHGIKADDNPVSTALANIIPGGVDADRPATCVEDDEIAVILNMSRKQCRHKQSGVLKIDSWHAALIFKFQMLTGYRPADTAKLHDGNIKGDFLIKGAGEAAKSAKTHRLPISTQMRDLIDESVAMRDRDLDTLSKRFKWSKADLETYKEHAVFGDGTANTEPCLFPSLTTGKQHKQITRALGTFRDFIESKGLIEPQEREVREDEWLDDDLLRPYDMRATFATHCELADVDELQTARFMGHAVSIGGVKMTSKYKSKSKFNDRALAAMQRVSDHLYNIAAH